MACEKSVTPEGIYSAVNPNNTDSTIELILEPNSKKGQFKIADEVMDFKWEAKNNQLWLHTKTGGVLMGIIIDNQVIDMTLPGVGKLSLKK